MNPIIKAEHVRKTYDGFVAVNDLSFEVHRGGLFAFLGLNGAGKSTTINILCSIIKKDSGKITIDGYDLDLDKDARKIKSMIGIVFQHSVLDKELTVYQNLRSRASLYDLSKQEIDDQIDHLITILDLKPILKKQYKNLSGGQRRRVDIARALIHKPKILFLDEPTTGLDPNTRLAVWDILNELMKTEDLTVFLTTHYMEEVVNANYVVIIDEGNIVASGHPNTLKDLYATDMLRIITPRSNKIDEILTSLKKDYVYHNEAYLIKVKSSLEAYDIISLDKELFANFEVAKGNMDHVFLNVTGKKLEVKEHEKAQ